MKLFRDLAVALLLMVLAVPTFTDAAAAFGGVSPKQAKQKIRVQCHVFEGIDNEFCGCKRDFAGYAMCSR